MTGRTVDLLPTSAEKLWRASVTLHKAGRMGFDFPIENPGQCRRGTGFKPQL